MFVRLCAVCFFLSLSLHTLQSPAVQAEPHPTLKHKNFLILHSYAPDHDWTRKLNRGIFSLFDQLDWTNSIRIEYMDSNNFLNERYLDNLAALYAEKYAEFHIDGIIAADNDALNFMTRYGRRLFADAPIVATGINSDESIAIPATTANIIIEQADHLATLKQALNQNPDAINGYVIGDDSTTGRLLLAEVERVITQLQTPVAIRVLPPMVFEDLIEFVATCKPQDFIYLLPYSRDVSGKSFDQGYVATFLSRITEIPIYVSWDFQLGTGVLGGRVISAYDHGRFAAQILLSILENTEDISLKAQPEKTQKTIYDFNALRRFNIPEDSLPEDTIVISKPPTLYEQHKMIILPSLAIIFGLLTCLILILRNLTHQQTINRNNKEIISLHSELIETQKELVSTLGEVIETRSEETGNHVRRVALISRFIGEKLGLSPNEVDILEAASPLHDVGKVGISESILHKPGRLSSEEFAVVKEHTTIGKNILQFSDRKLLSSACSIAFQHHERWDGTGYPSGLKGKEIDLFARITMLVDVYDALASARCYKEAWPMEQIIAHLKKGSGRLFDPGLVAIFLENIEEIDAIRKKNTAPDHVGAHNRSTAGVKPVKKT